ncbi:MAG: hypothetical protein NVSMB59_23220 [Vulcanimicrobiaceae bacterium]
MKHTNGWRKHDLTRDRTARPIPGAIVYPAHRGSGPPSAALKARLARALDVAFRESPEIIALLLGPIGGAIVERRMIVPEKKRSRRAPYIKT